MEMEILAWTDHCPVDILDIGVSKLRVNILNFDKIKLPKIAKCLLVDYSYFILTLIKFRINIKFGEDGFGKFLECGEYKTIIFSSGYFSF